MVLVTKSFGGPGYFGPIDEIGTFYDHPVRKVNTKTTYYIINFEGKVSL